MSTNKTPNLNLHSWVETDPVLMREFNENFNALDSAAATYGNCRIITGSYVGTGQCGDEYSNSLFFNIAPKWLFITPQSNTYTNCDTLHSPGYMTINLMAVKHCIEHNKDGNDYAIINNPSASSSTYAVQVSLDDDGRKIIWRIGTVNTSSVAHQANSTNSTYFYTAIA